MDWDSEIGANTLDTLLAQHFTKQFADKHKLDVKAVAGNMRAMAKMKKQVCTCAHAHTQFQCFFVCRVCEGSVRTSILFYECKGKRKVSVTAVGGPWCD